MLRLNLLLFVVVALGLGGATAATPPLRRNQLDVEVPAAEKYREQVDEGAVGHRNVNWQLNTSLTERLTAALLETAQLNATVTALREKVQCAHNLSTLEQEKNELQVKNCELRLSMLQEHAKSGAACERLEALMLQKINGSLADQAPSKELLKCRAEISDLEEMGKSLTQEKQILETQYNEMKAKLQDDLRVARETLAASHLRIATLESCCANSSAAAAELASLRARTDELQRQLVAITASKTAVELKLVELQKLSDAQMVEQKRLLQTCEQQSRGLQAQVAQLSSSQQQLTQQASQLTAQANLMQRAFCRGKEVKSLVKLGSGSYYYDKNAMLNWYEAQKFCRGLGLDLASVETQQEHTLISNHLLASGLENGITGFVWTSGTDQAVEGRYYWSATGDNFSFTLWHPGQPDNNGSGGENCVELWNLGVIKWNDRSCTAKGRFICELHPACG